MDVNISFENPNVDFQIDDLFTLEITAVPGAKGDPGDPATDEQVQTAVDNYLDEHPEIVVEDGSITTAKLADEAVTEAKLSTELQGTISDLEDDITQLNSELTAKADAISNTASGAIASFSDGADDLPMDSVVCHIEPTQSGSGDPSPTNVRPISGYTGLTLTRTGKNLWGGLTMAQAFDGKTNSYTLDTTAKTFTFSRQNGSAQEIFRGAFKENTAYTLLLNCSCSANNASLQWVYTDGTYDGMNFTNTEKTAVLKTTNPNKTIDYLRLAWNTTGLVTVYYDESGIFEGNISVDDFEPYNGQTYSADWTTEAGTVYGGTLDVVSGLLTVDRAVYTFTGTENLSVEARGGGNRFITPVVTSGWKTFVSGDNNSCNTYKVSSSPVGTNNTDATICAYNNRFYWRDDRATTTTEMKALLAEAYSGGNPVVYCGILTTPQTYQLTPQEVKSLLGANNIWHSDNGNTDVTYRADTKLYTDDLAIDNRSMIAPVESAYIATRNYTTGSLLIVNNTLYKVTANIGNGGAITPNTNVTQTTLAEIIASL